MSCSRAFATSRSVCSLGIGTASFCEQLRDASRTPARRARTRETRPAAPAGTARCPPPRIDHRQHAIGVGAHLRRDRSDWRSRSGTPRRRSEGTWSRSSVRPAALARSRRHGRDELDRRQRTADDARVPARQVGAMRAACRDSAPAPRTDSASSSGTAAATPDRGWPSCDPSPCCSRRCAAGTCASSRPAAAAARVRRTTAPARRPAARRRRYRRRRAAARGRRLRACSGPASASTATSSRRARSRSRYGSLPSGVTSAEKPRQRRSARRSRVEARRRARCDRRASRHRAPDPSRSRMLVTMRTSREPDRNLPARSTTMVCGRPTGMPISSMTVRHSPLRVLHLQRRRLEHAGRPGARRRCRSRTRSRSSR